MSGIYEFMRADRERQPLLREDIDKHPEAVKMFGAGRPPQQPPLGSGELGPSDDLPEPDKEREKILLWRFNRLVDGGFPPLEASALAVVDIDVRDAVALIENGCAPELAARILL